MCSLLPVLVVSASEVERLEARRRRHERLLHAGVAEGVDLQTDGREGEEGVCEGEQAWERQARRVFIYCGPSNTGIRLTAHGISDYVVANNTAAPYLPGSLGGHAELLLDQAMPEAAGVVASDEMGGSGVNDGGVLPATQQPCP